MVVVVVVVVVVVAAAAAAAAAPGAPRQAPAPPTSSRAKTVLTNHLGFGENLKATSEGFRVWVYEGLGFGFMGV